MQDIAVINKPNNLLKDNLEFVMNMLKNEYMVVGEYIDRALTGTTDKRPEFLRMIEDSKKKMFNYVIVYQLDRFARNRYDSATYKAKLTKNGVRVLSARENISDDASGVLMESVLEGRILFERIKSKNKAWNERNRIERSLDWWLFALWLQHI